MRVGLCASRHMSAGITNLSPPPPSSNGFVEKGCASSRQLRLRCFVDGWLSNHGRACGGSRTPALASRPRILKSDFARTARVAFVDECCNIKGQLEGCRLVPACAVRWISQISGLFEPCSAQDLALVLPLVGVGTAMVCCSGNTWT